MADRERDADNFVKWQKDPGGHVESFFLKGNAPDRALAFWLKFTIFSPVGDPRHAVAEVWAVYFDGETRRHVAAKETYPIDRAKLGFDKFELQFGRSALARGETRGGVEIKGQAVAWDLVFTTGKKALHHFPMERMYHLSLPKFKILTPHPDSVFEGELLVNGTIVPVEGWRGEQGHNWGRAHSERYVWAHCDLWKDKGGKPVEETYFEGFSSKIKLGPFTSPFLTATFIDRNGESRAFNRLSHLYNKSVSLSMYEWRFICDDGPDRLEGEFVAPREDIVGLLYRNPDGSAIHCLNSKIASGRIVLSRRAPSGVREPVAELVSDRSSALEIAVRETDHGARMYV